MSKSLSFLLLLLISIQFSCSSQRSGLVYNNVEYPKKGTKLKVHRSAESDLVQVSKAFKFKQTTYTSEYTGCVKVRLKNGGKKEFDVKWVSWIRPERIDLYITPRFDAEFQYNAMPKGHNIIYLKDDKTAVRLNRHPARHWALVIEEDGHHKLVGAEDNLNLSKEMDEYPILYLTYVFATQVYEYF
ncbi:MAG: hypothetical protein JXR19_00215 [Bacteroidia bacterium]